jgi:hypothetical protein
MKLRCLAIALVFLAASASDSWGQSQKKSQPNEQTQAAKQPTATDQRGTEQSPAFVKIIPTPKTAAEAIQDAKDRDEKASSDLWIIRWTGAVALFTLVLAGVGAWQGVQLKRSVDLARAEYLSSHPPRLIVRHVGLAADHSLALTSILLGHDADINGGLSVVNGGGTNASIVRARYKIYFSNIGLPVRSPLMYENPSVLLEPKTVIKGGEAKVIDIWSKVDFGPPDSTGLRDIRQFEREGWIVYVMGEIRYQDDSGADHFMGFCRERQSNGRFRAVDDPDYEYQD